MTAEIVDGREIARTVLEEVADRAGRLHARNVWPRLSFVLIGASRPAELYARRLQALGEPLGLNVERISLPHNVSLDSLESTVTKLSRAADVDGILVQLPLPDHLLEADLGDWIDARKDVDGITVRNAGRLYLEMPGQFPSTALAMMQTLDHHGVDPAGLNAVVVGRSKIVGHPVAEMLLRRDATVTIAHRQTRDLASHTRRAEILMVGAGSPHLVTASMVMPGAFVVDAGINATPEGVKGDVEFETVKEIAGAITPVPGGIGPITNAVLLRNLIQSAEQRHHP